MRALCCGVRGIAQEFVYRIRSGHPSRRPCSRPRHLSGQIPRRPIRSAHELADPRTNRNFGTPCTIWENARLDGQEKSSPSLSKMTVNRELLKIIAPRGSTQESGGLHDAAPSATETQRVAL